MANEKKPTESIVNQSGQQHRTQTNITGDVNGPVLSGDFYNKVYIVIKILLFREQHIIMIFKLLLILSPVLLSSSKAMLKQPLTCIGSQISGNVYVNYLLDASNGMMHNWIGTDQSKMDSVQTALIEHLQSLRCSTNIGLIAYGHRYSVMEDSSCKDVETLFPMQSGQLETLAEKLQSIQPQGRDCLAHALPKTLAQFQGDSEKTYIVVLITEGGDTCGGNPVDVLKYQRDVGVNIPIYVVDLGTENSEQLAQLKDLAEISHGYYYSVGNSNELETALEEIAQNLNTQ